MCDISHIEIYKIETGEREKPALLTLKGFEKYKEEQNRMLYFIDQKRYYAIDIKDYFDNIHKYLLNQDNIDKEILRDTSLIEKMLNEIIK